MDVDRELRIEPYRGAARAARRFVEDAIRDWRLGPRAREITLVSHELIANAFLHARSAALLRLRRRTDSLLVEVADTDPRLPCPTLVHSLLRTSGRGLMIVELLSLRWGVRPVDAGKVVWAELPLTGARHTLDAPPARPRNPV
ncbi:hypothetical protein Athai_07440 [Actinocatenispora thailandica]|uniref:Histidine kinase/HSP90-like ATPase domain-containing protein n=1 Tax=Actinocatenispora thailandica TaxID=227318 RepID=A0A7R7DKQ1_9ACTN|nr:ATP-binding protein [Actinocatenispora thailandica]BCJ33241.1 hypothetical protein Athai_07440 [Actinocatenispora thailandica]